MDCFRNPGLQVAADGGCKVDVVHRISEGYKAWGALKSLLSNRWVGVKYEEVSI